MSTQSAHYTKLQSLNKEMRSQLLNTYPELSDSLREDAVEQLADMVLQDYGSASYQAKPSVESQVSQSLCSDSNQVHELAWDISVEEFQIVLDKLQAIAQLPPGSPPDETLLYLEQQLSDVFGFTVCSRLRSMTLPIVSGSIFADQHIPTVNTLLDTNTLTHVKEAGSRKHRSALGLERADNGKVSEQTYTIGLPLYALPEWSQEHEQLKGTYRNTKLAVINPNDARAVIAMVGDISPTLDTLFQCTGSPAVIRHGLFWSPKANGKCILFLVDDPTNEVPLGVIQLHHPTSS